MTKMGWFISSLRSQLLQKSLGVMILTVSSVSKHILRRLKMIHAMRVVVPCTTLYQEGRLDETHLTSQYWWSLTKRSQYIK